MTTGFEPAPSTVTGWCTGLLCYVTMGIALRYLDSNQEGRSNNPLVYPLTDTGMRMSRFAVRYRPRAGRTFVAEAGFEPALQGL